MGGYSDNYYWRELDKKKKEEKKKSSEMLTLSGAVPTSWYSLNDSGCSSDSSISSDSGSCDSGGGSCD